MNDDYYRDGFGATVRVVRTLIDGDTVTESMPPMLAAWSVMYDPNNGVIYRSARVLWANLIDGYGMSA